MAGSHGEKFCLRWNDFEQNISSSFRELKEDKDFFDVTLACDDNQLQAHKVILSACSPFFRSVLKKNPHQHPLLYLKGVKYVEIQLVLNFMYHGEVNVAQDELNSFLSVAEDLQVKGLSQNQPKPNRKPQESSSFKIVPEEESSPTITLPNHRPIKQQRPKPNYDQQPMNAEKLQARREIQQHSVTPQIKTEAPVVLDCDDEQENTHQIVESVDYQADHTGYEYEQSYQDESMMYQEGEIQLDMGQMQHRNQDGQGGWNAKEFVCDICYKQFSSKKSLQNHMWIHKGKTTCSVCNKIFSTTSSLNLHMRNTHGFVPDSASLM